MVNFREIEEGEPLLFRDRRNNEVYSEIVTFAGFTDTGHPVVEFEDGKRLMVLPEQLAYPQEEEFVNIRIYRADRDRLAATMKYGDTMAEKIHTLIERVASEDQPRDDINDTNIRLYPCDARKELETYLNEDLRGAVVTVTAPIVDEGGRIYFDEIALRLENGARGRDRGRDAGQVALAQPGG